LKVSPFANFWAKNGRVEKHLAFPVSRHTENMYVSCAVTAIDREISPFPGRYANTGIA
jgi:hypothetical protein